MKNLALVCGGALLLSVPLPSWAAPAAPLPPLPDVNLAWQLSQSFVQVAEKASRSVVVVQVAQREISSELELDDSHPLHEFFKKRMEEERENRRNRPTPPEFNGQGSGFVVHRDGYILTNFHVIENAERIQVRDRDGRRFEASVRGVDPQSDLAVLKINGSDLPPVNLGDSQKTRVGEYAIAIGAPFDLDYSVTFGHVSAKGRSSILQDGSADQDFIQTDANINPGNSGGPLVNLRGEVIGINTIIRGLNTGIGFAIPINLAREVSDQLIEHGHFTRAWLGVGIESLGDSPLRDRFPKVGRGVVITAILPGGPADKSELRPADIVTSVDEVPVGSVVQLKNQIRSKAIGRNVSLAVVRGGREIEVKVRPEAWPSQERPVREVVKKAPTEKGPPPRIGLTVESIDQDLARKFQVETDSGVIVTAVEENSPAALQGIQPGTIITQVEFIPVTSLKQFQRALAAGRLAEGIVLHLHYRGVDRFELVQAPD